MNPARMALIGVLALVVLAAAAAAGGGAAEYLLHRQQQTQAAAAIPGCLSFRALAAAMRPRYPAAERVYKQSACPSILRSNHHASMASPHPRPPRRRAAAVGGRGRGTAPARLTGNSSGNHRHHRGVHTPSPPGRAPVPSPRPSPHVRRPHSRPALLRAAAALTVTTHPAARITVKLGARLGG
jgi:hypothetical protein